MVEAGGTVLWDSAFLVDEKSMVGRVMHVMLGYTDRPTAAQLIVYLAVIAGILLLTRWARGNGTPGQTRMHPAE